MQEDNQIYAIDGFTQFVKKHLGKEEFPSEFPEFLKLCMLERFLDETFEVRAHVRHFDWRDAWKSSVMHGREYLSHIYQIAEDRDLSLRSALQQSIDFIKGNKEDEES